MLKAIPNEFVSWVYNAGTPKESRGIAWFGCNADFSKCGQEYKNKNDKRVKKRIEKGQLRKLYDWWHIEQVKNVSKEKTKHPCQMPLAVMKRIIAITDADTILDPFMGSGTTLRAAKDLGRKSIGIEVEEKYCEIAARRLRQEVLSL